MCAVQRRRDKKKGRLKRLGFLTPAIGALILMALHWIYPKVALAHMATFAVIIAMIIASGINRLYERIKK
jgi:putative flippase GtrA